MNLKGRNFLKLMDYTPEEILYLIDLAADLKKKKKEGILHDSLIGKNIALIFEKTSTVPAALLRLQRMILECTLHTLIQAVPRLGKRRASRTLQEY